MKQTQLLPSRPLSSWGYRQDNNLPWHHVWQEISTDIHRSTSGKHVAETAIAPQIYSMCPTELHSHLAVRLGSWDYLGCGLWEGSWKAMQSRWCNSRKAECLSACTHRQLCEAERPPLPAISKLDTDMRTTPLWVIQLRLDADLFLQHSTAHPDQGKEHRLATER